MDNESVLFEIQVYPDKTVILVEGKEIVQEGGEITIQARGINQRRNEVLCAQSAALSAEPAVATG